MEKPTHFFLEMRQLFLIAAFKQSQLDSYLIHEFHNLTQTTFSSIFPLRGNHNPIDARGNSSSQRPTGSLPRPTPHHKRKSCTRRVKKLCLQLAGASMQQKVAPLKLQWAFGGRQGTGRNQRTRHGRRGVHPQLPGLVIWFRRAPSAAQLQ